MSTAAKIGVARAIAWCATYLVVGAAMLYGLVKFFLWLLEDL
jgi:hypothetical protein